MFAPALVPMNAEPSMPLDPVPAFNPMKILLECDESDDAPVPSDTIPVLEFSKRNLSDMGSVGRPVPTTPPVV